MSVLDIITQLLKDEGKTQKELCERIGISGNVFTDWKSGRLNSYKKYLPEIADYLGVSVDYLLGKTNNKAVEEPVILNRFKKDVKDMDDDMQRLFMDTINEHFKKEFEEPEKITKVEADYDSVYSRVSLLLTHCMTTKIPIDVFELANELSNLKLIRYSDLAIEMGLPIPLCAQFLGNKYGSYIDKDGKAFIYWNDTINDMETTRLTIAQNMGHFVLEHKKYADTKIYNNTKNIYEELKKEIDCFARNILSPVCFMEELNVDKNDIERIQKVFQISEEAAKDRSLHYEIDKNKLTDEDFIIHRFSDSLSLLKNK